MKKIFNYIDGKLAKPEKAKYIDVFNPSRGKIYARCPESTSSDLKSAVTSATKAFNSWREFSNEQRSKILFKIQKKSYST